MTSPLPIVAGVAPSSQWLPSGPWKTVLEFFTERFPRVDVETWTVRMAKGEVTDETGQRLDPQSAYRVGACIFYYREVETESRIPFVEQVLYRDEHILVADKPHFLPVIPSGRFLHQTLLVRLRKTYNVESLVPIHRLDRETAGVVMFSVNPGTRGHYTSLFRDRNVTKVYEALAPTMRDLTIPTTRRSRLVRGEPFFRMKEVSGVANSETHISPLRNLGCNTLYKLVPVTGRKHQLRVHLAALGIPIINDKLYPAMSPSDDDDFSNPLKLLAKSLSFQDPLTGQQRYFESEMKL
ncbi:MAG TPA: pseudouridine synthase [Pyrinomonadaceae bacterium]|jgi:Pseudouridylate synthases, 23S RNA-specific|nr:pseudouridine synthase [Pyrinomonadaceae bacterium]